MTRTDFVRMAIFIVKINKEKEDSPLGPPFGQDTINALAEFFVGECPLFNRQRWLTYIENESRKPLELVGR